MIIAKQMEIRDNIKSYFDTAYDGEVIIVPVRSRKPLKEALAAYRSGVELEE